MPMGRSDIRLMMDQTADSVRILQHFRFFLGGALYQGKAATGSARPTVRWQVVGSKVAKAAAALGSIPSMKQAQLLIAAQGNVAKAERVRVQGELTQFKQRHHVPDQLSESLWPYFAGFFDAEGAVIVHSIHAGLRLKLDQVNPWMLVHLLRLLHENHLFGWKVYHRDNCSSLVCNTLKDCKQTLKLLLANGLLVKKKQAELALSLSAENHLEIREAISSLNGFQARYRRLDTDSIARAQEIHRLQSRLHRLSEPEYGSLLSKLDELRVEHKLQKLISRCDLIRKDMRQALRRGGRVV